MAFSTIKRNKINLNYELKKVDDIDYGKDLKELDKVLLNILKFDNKLIGELYDTVSYSSCFLKMISASNIEDCVRSLLGLSKRNTIYSWTHRVRIDPQKMKEELMDGIKKFFIQFQKQDLFKLGVH